MKLTVTVQTVALAWQMTIIGIAILAATIAVMTSIQKCPKSKPITSA
jgi:hypothetical protein